MADDQIRQIVQAVLAQLTGQNSGAVPQAVVIKEQPDNHGADPGRDVKNVPADDLSDLEDLAMVDLQKEMPVPQPQDRAALEYFKKTTPARIGVWRTGPCPLTRTILRFRADHAVAQDAVFSELDESLAEEYGMLLVQSMVTSKDHYLTRPDLGKKLSPEAVEKIRNLCPAGADVQIVVADGLSSKALQANLPHILPALKQGLKAEGLSGGKDIMVRYGRVEIMDEIGMLTQARVVILLVGERPGLGTAESMSAYIIYQPHKGTLIADHTMVSNIHKGGTPPAEAGAHLSGLIRKIYDARVSGIKFSL